MNYVNAYARNREYPDIAQCSGAVRDRAATIVGTCFQFNEGVAKNLCARSRKCQVLQVLRKISLGTCNPNSPIAPAKVIAQISHYGTAYECVAQALHNGTK